MAKEFVFSSPGNQGVISMLEWERDYKALGPRTPGKVCKSIRIGQMELSRPSLEYPSVRQGCGRAANRVELREDPFTSHAFEEIVDAWNRVTGRYNCIVICTIIVTLAPVVLAFYCHSEWRRPWDTSLRYYSQSSSALVTESLSRSSLRGHAVIRGLRWQCVAEHSLVLHMETFVVQLLKGIRSKWKEGGWSVIGLMLREGIHAQISCVCRELVLDDTMFCINRKGKSENKVGSEYRVRRVSNCEIETKLRLKPSSKVNSSWPYDLCSEDCRM